MEKRRNKVDKKLAIFFPQVDRSDRSDSSDRWDQVRLAQIDLIRPDKIRLDQLRSDFKKITWITSGQVRLGKIKKAQITLL